MDTCSFCGCGYQYPLKDTHMDGEVLKICSDCDEKNPVNAPYSLEEYEEAKKQGLDLDDWNDYCKYFQIGEEPNYDDM